MTLRERIKDTLETHEIVWDDKVLKDLEEIMNFRLEDYIEEDILTASDARGLASDSWDNLNVRLKDSFLDQIVEESDFDDCMSAIKNNYEDDLKDYILDKAEYELNMIENPCKNIKQQAVFDAFLERLKNIY